MELNMNTEKKKEVEKKRKNISSVTWQERVATLKSVEGRRGSTFPGSGFN